MPFAGKPNAETGGGSDLSSVHQHVPIVGFAGRLSWVKVGGAGVLNKLICHVVPEVSTLRVEPFDGVSGYAAMTYLSPLEDKIWTQIC